MTLQWYYNDITMYRELHRIGPQRRCLMGGEQREGTHNFLGW